MTHEEYEEQRKLREAKTLEKVEIDGSKVRWSEHLSPAEKAAYQAEVDKRRKAWNGKSPNKVTTFNSKGKPVDYGK